MRAAGFVLLTVGSAWAGPFDWPPFLPARDEYPESIARAITRLWTAPTFAREVRAAPASVPPGSYLRFVDAPDLTAAAGRRLGIADYDVTVLGDDWYEADDHDGAHGIYRILLREGGRRVVLSWGTHRGAILGAVHGSALTRLDFSDEGGRTGQRLAVQVIIDSALAARLTRTMLPIFGWVVDRKLTEGFRMTARVAAWAQDKPEEFCTFFRGALTSERRGELGGAFEECARPVSLRPSPLGTRSDGRASAPPVGDAPLPRP